MVLRRRNAELGIGSSCCSSCCSRVVDIGICWTNLVCEEKGREQRNCGNAIDFACAWLCDRCVAWPSGDLRHLTSEESVRSKLRRFSGGRALFLPFQLWSLTCAQQHRRNHLTFLCSLAGVAETQPAASSSTAQEANTPKMTRGLMKMQAKERVRDV